MRGADGAITPLKFHTIDARISAGISKSDPHLSEEGMARGLDAIRALLAAVAPFAPARTILVATSAVREADNGGDFIAQAREQVGLRVRVIFGSEEARRIHLASAYAVADSCDEQIRALDAGLFPPA